MKRFQRFFAVLLAICFTNVTMIQTAQATLISTEEVARMEAAVQSASSAHERLASLLARVDVQEGLERMGVSPEFAKERIAALTDEEAQMLAEQIESAPAGAGVLGAILLIFFVLLVTDILGLTKIFPFTRSIR